MSGDLERIKPKGQLAEMRSQMKASGGLRDYTLVSKSMTNMEGKGIHRLPARASQSLRLLGVTSSRYRMGLQDGTTGVQL